LSSPSELTSYKTKSYGLATSAFFDNASLSHNFQKKFGHCGCDWRATPKFEDFCIQQQPLCGAWSGHSETLPATMGRPPMNVAKSISILGLIQVLLNFGLRLSAPLLIQSE
jgi:hypothetical protein